MDPGLLSEPARPSMQTCGASRLRRQSFSRSVVVKSASEKTNGLSLVFKRIVMIITH